MIRTDLNKASFAELTKHLTEVEESPLKITESDCCMTITACPTAKAVATLSNIDIVCRWAEAHGCTLRLVCFDNRLQLEIRRLMN